jgi:hypothetical protein
MFKLLLKWVIKLILKASQTLSKEENANALRQLMNDAEQEGREKMSTMRQSLEDVEGEISSRVDAFQRKLMGICRNNSSDINDLRAEVAELRAELRALHEQPPTV